MENSLKGVLDPANSILILLPTDPTFDTFAAGLSFFLALQGTKTTQIAASSPVTVEFNRLIGVNKVASELGNKNLVVSFYDYKAEDIERVSYDIEDGQFRLTVIPKPGIAAPNKDQVKLSYSGVSADTVILVGGVNENHFPAIFSKDLLGAKLVHIGNRVISSDSSKGILSFATPSSSISELIAKVLSQLSLPVDPDIATNLLMGIEDATDNYKSPEVTAETFEITAGLIRAGGRRLAKVGLDRQNFPPGAIPQTVTKSEPYREDLSMVADEKIEDKESTVEEPPEDWLQPKIYKGTSVS